MEPFVTHRGKIAVLDWSDVNTDLIIPARYLKRIERTGYGSLLFADKRYEPGTAPPVDAVDQPGTESKDFPLNRDELRDATILVVGKNFGCGSSREHAVWAVAQAGYRAVIAPGPGEGFADIFEGNAYNSGLLPIELSESDWQQVARINGGEAIIDLNAKTITLTSSAEANRPLSFEVPEENRQRLLRGLDFVAETLEHDAEITQYEAKAPGWAMLTAS